MYKYAGIFRCSLNYLIPIFFLFGQSAAHAVLSITDEGGSVTISNDSADVADIATIESAPETIVSPAECVCINSKCSGNAPTFTLAAKSTKGKPADRIGAFRCAYSAPSENTTITVTAQDGDSASVIIEADDGGSDPGGDFNPSCGANQIGFTGVLRSFDGGNGNDYLVFRLESDEWGTNNYIHNAVLHTYRHGDDNSDAANVLFGGEQFNGWSGGELSLSGSTMPKNSLALATVQNGTNTRGTNVAFQSGWLADEWLLCGTPAYDEKFAVWDDYPGEASDNDVSALGGGVNVMGGEYSCAQGWGFHHHSAVGVSHSQLTTMLSDWGVKTVRLPMNEHCWVSGLDDPAGGTYWFDYIQTNNDKSGKRSNFRAELLASPENCASDNSHCLQNMRTYSVCDGTDSNAACSTQGAGYRESFIDLVEQLTTANINVVLDLHWTDNNGDGSGTALDLTVLPGELSKVFWRDVAATFRDYADGSPKVMYNLFNEPRGIPGDAGLWVRWRDGDSSFVGMQELVNVVRSEATNDIVIGGLDYGGDLRGWLTHAPFDHLNRVWADSHSYPTGDYKCWADDSKELDGYACWDRTMLPIINEGFGAMFGEAGNSISRGGCGGEVLKYLYNWLENIRQNASIPVLQWAFLPGGAGNDSNNPSGNSCKIPSVITRWPGKARPGTPEYNSELDFLAGGEYNKDTSDPTPLEDGDDGTWAGCLNYAYLNTDFIDWTSSDLDSDPVSNGHYGNCVGYFGPEN